MSDNEILRETKRIANQLGLVETIQVFGNHVDSAKTTLPNFSFIIIIDFESTCWKEKGYNQPEIIEFPAVLLNLKTGLVEDEFQQYVMPTENPKLSDFCKQLTGIKQEQVDEGVPLPTCLLLFNKWIKKVVLAKNIVFHESKDNKSICSFLTWSDWDLAVCLQNECKRKNICKPEMLSQWIDLRLLYREFYKRRPKGLRGALSELGLTFEGREHSGVCDARNTANLLWKMVQDGLVLRITSSSSNKKGTIKVSAPSCISKVDRPLTDINPNTPLSSKRKLFDMLVDSDISKDKHTTILDTRKENSILHTKSLIQIQQNKSIIERLSKSDVTTPMRNRLVPTLSCRRTPPLCNCGRRATWRIVSLPGPNQGREFYTCSSRRSLGTSAKTSCNFFKWSS